VNTFTLEIRTPRQTYGPRDVASLDVPAETGRLTVLAHHQPLLCAVARGSVRIRDAGRRTEHWITEPGTLTVGGNRAALLVRDIRRDAAPSS